MVKQLNPLTTCVVPPLYEADGTTLRPGFRVDADPKYAGALPAYEVAPAVQAHDFGAGAVKWEAATTEDLLNAAIASGHTDLVVEIED